MKNSRRIAPLALLLLFGCGADDDNSADAGADLGTDTSDASDVGTDTSTDADTAADTIDGGDTGPSPGDRVDVALDGVLPEPVEGAVSVYQIDSEDQIPAGMSVQAMIGDWIIESDRALFVIEGEDRTMSPCPWGGSVIDAVYIDGTGTRHEETVGEICPMINLGQTFAGHEFEVLADGSDGRAILAVTGEMQELDFLNIEAMAGGFLGGLSLELALDPSRVRPVTITVYYALTADSNRLRVITAFRNDGDELHHLATGHLLRPAGTGVFFNPLNSVGGYGYESLGPSSLTATPISFTAYTHESAGWAYVPDPVEGLGDDLPVGGGSAAVSGVTAALMGTTDLLGVLLAQAPALPDLQGVIGLEPGESEFVGHHFVVGDGSLHTVIDEAYASFGIETATIGGVVRDGAGAPVAGVRVTAVDEQARGLNQALTGADGTYAFTVPIGSTYELRAYSAARRGVAANLVTPAGAEALSADIETEDPGVLRVRVTTPDGEPTAARLTVICPGGCARPLGAEADRIVDALPGDFQALVQVPPSGEASVELPAGSYGVVVSRGLEWSLWPPDAHLRGGEPIEVEPGNELMLDAEIAHVVDTSDAVSGDLHVHALASSDSSVANEDRVWSFVGDGLDVIVSTDHDYIVDFTPIIDAEGIAGELRSLIGAEITTSSYGHLNAFPLAVDETHRTGGALDWGNGADLALIPADVYGWAHEFPGEQVVQINHPEGAGTINGMDADVLLGISRFSAEQLGLPEQPPNPEIPWDTGFWSDDFTAIELANGLNRSSFWVRARWWLTMIGRGFHPTGTAVTDTHKLYSDIGGVPRTFVFVTDGADGPTTMDDSEFVASVNQGRTIGTNGPFFRAELVTDAGARATFGETIENGEGLRVDVMIDVPEWITVDRIDLYTNVTEGIYSRRGGENSDEIPPSFSVPVSLEEDDLLVSAVGTVEHRHYQKTVSVPLEFDTDGYVVVMVRGISEETATLWPVVPHRGETPFAFSNPIFVDADGGGYDSYPLQDLIDEILSQKSFDPQWPLAAGWTRDGIHHDGHEHHFNDGELAIGTRPWAAELVDRMSCDD